jgi:hypothetical protein
VIEWRYLRNPVCEQHLVTIEEQGELIGWAALELAEKGCLLLDHLLPLERREGGAALASLVRYVAGLGAPRLTMRAIAHGPYFSLFLRHGFLQGRSVDAFQVLAGDEPFVETLLDEAAWHLVGGDLNPEATPWSIITTPPELVEAEEAIRPSIERTATPEREAAAKAAAGGGGGE